MCVFWFSCCSVLFVNVNQMSEYKSDRILEYVRSSIRQNTAYRIIVSDKMPYTHKVAFTVVLRSSGERCVFFFLDLYAVQPALSLPLIERRFEPTFFSAVGPRGNKDSDHKLWHKITEGKASGVSATAKMCLHLLANAAETHHLSNSKRCGDWPRKAVVQRS